MTDRATTESEIQRLYLVDASGFIFRAFHAIPFLTRSDGTPVNAVYGFTNMMIKLLTDMQAEYIGVLFDADRTTFRNELSAQYKANRPELPEELVPQFPLVREATQAFNLDCLEVQGYEADDLIATYTQQALEKGASVIIVSSDKDLMQLVSDRVQMYDPLKNRWIGPREVEEKFGVPPEKVIDVLALAGDTSDNIPGVPGIGIKTAAQLIRQYGDMETLLARASEIKQAKRREALLAHADTARLSRQLIRLRTDVPVPVPVEQLVRRPIDKKTLLTFLEEQGFKSIAARIQNGSCSGIFSQPNSKNPSEHETPTLRYELVQTLAALEQWIARATEAGYVAVDTETTSLDQMQARLVGISLCVEPFHACYIPLAHTNGMRPDTLPFAQSSEEISVRQLSLDLVLDALRPLFADPSVLKIGHNIKYDSVVFAQYGLTLAPVDDTMLLSYVLEGGAHGHGLDELAQLYLGYTTVTYKEVAGSGKTQIPFEQVPLDKALRYAAEDADITMRLYRVLKPRLVKEHMVTVYETLERPLIPVLAAMEQHGIAVDLAQLKQLSADLAQRLANLESDIHRLAGRPFNIGSPKQLGDILFEEMGIAGGQKGKAGAYATSADVLESLAIQGYELPARVLEWRHLDKLKSTYADALMQQIHPRTRRVHTSFSMASASTGRLASTDPNLQNIPVRTEEGRKIRQAFVAEPGHLLVSLDYSQIELRLLAHIADVEGLKQAFREGMDIHALTASQVFGVPADALDAALRRKAKAINFGIIYGISPFGLARQLGVEQSEAAEYIQAYFDRYPGIQRYMEWAKQFCREHGYVETLFGRRCYVQGIHDKNPARRSFAERAAINAPIQGSAADILKRAMIRVPPALEQHGLSPHTRLLLTVHDELLLEVREDAVAHVADVVKKIMETAPLPAISLSVPLVVDVGIGRSWAEAH
ncbi:MAG: DNA polymerase I [Nitrospirae bacterium]|nr:MAG: DNA polymerase I [Nitrospirota bacterium]